MMHAISSKSSESSQIARLTLAKFSHTTTSINHSGPFSWTHIIGNGEITAVFERFPMLASGATQTLLKVFQGYNLLEEIDLSYYSREATSQFLGNTKSHFAVVVKLPCLAVKYTTAGPYIRRFQIKFSSDGDFYTALAILSDIKCPFSEPNGTSSRPTSRLASSAWHLGRAPSSMITRGSFPASSSVSDPSDKSAFPPSDRASVTGTDATGLPSFPSGTGHLSQNNTNIIPGSNPGNRNATIEQDHFTSESGTIQSSSNTGSRPSTAATGCHDIQVLNQLLPPRRELPFSKPAPKRSVEAGNPSDTTPKRPVIHPETSKTAKTRNPRQRKATRTRTTKTTGKPLPEATTMIADQGRQDSLSLSQPNRSNERISPSPSQMKTTRNHEPETQRPAILIAQNSDNNFPCNSTDNQGGGRSVQTQNDTTMDPHSIQPRLGLPSDRMTTADLSAYLAAPASERAALVESWVCQQLEDDTFLQLCLDVEGVWKRIALGR